MRLESSGGGDECDFHWLAGGFGSALEGFSNYCVTVRIIFRDFTWIFWFFGLPARAINSQLWSNSSAAPWNMKHHQKFEEDEQRKQKKHENCYMIDITIDMRSGGWKIIVSVSVSEFGIITLRLCISVNKRGRFSFCSAWGNNEMKRWKNRIFVMFELRHKYRWKRKNVGLEWSRTFEYCVVAFEIAGFDVAGAFITSIQEQMLF